MAVYRIEQCVCLGSGHQIRAEDKSREVVIRVSGKYMSGVNFIKVLSAHFWYEILAPKTTKLCFGFEIFWRKNFVQKSCG